METINDDSIKLLANSIDSTLLKPNAKISHIQAFCRDAERYGFGCVSVLPTMVKLAFGYLMDIPVNISSVIGYPTGCTYPKVKLTEAAMSIADGANELDIVMNLHLFANKKYKKVREEIERIADLASTSKVILKVIVETNLHSQAEKIEALQLVIDSGADFINTSTGTIAPGATIEDVLLLREHTAGRIKIKACGGIRRARFAFNLIAAGADRIGTSSAVAIIEEAAELSNENI